jgi:hypothetical protein
MRQNTPDLADLYTQNAPITKIGAFLSYTFDF